MTMATSKRVPLSATWSMPRSQFVPPLAVRPSIQPFTVSAPVWVETGVTGRFWLFVVLAGAVVAKVKSATCEGVPTSEFVNVFAAVLSEASELADRAGHVEDEGDVETARGGQARVVARGLPDAAGRGVVGVARRRA